MHTVGQRESATLPPGRCAALHCTALQRSCAALYLTCLIAACMHVSKQAWLESWSHRAACLHPAATRSVAAAAAPWKPLNTWTSS